MLVKLMHNYLKSKVYCSIAAEMHCNIQNNSGNRHGFQIILFYTSCNYTDLLLISIQIEQIITEMCRGPCRILHMQLDLKCNY